MGWKCMCGTNWNRKYTERHTNDEQNFFFHEKFLKSNFYLHSGITRSLNFYFIFYVYVRVWFNVYNNVHNSKSLFPSVFLCSRLFFCSLFCKAKVCMISLGVMLLVLKKTQTSTQWFNHSQKIRMNYIEQSNQNKFATSNLYEVEMMTSTIKETVVEKFYVKKHRYFRIIYLPLFDCTHFTTHSANQYIHSPPFVRRKQK